MSKNHLLARHHRGTFYLQPCEIPGYKFPPKCIPINAFAKRHNYSRDQLLTMLRDKDLFGISFKKWLFICPCPYSGTWTEKEIAEYWQKS